MGIRDQLMIHLLGHRLDEQLVAGVPTRQRRLRALRANYLTSIESRRRLADNWEAVLDRGRSDALGRIAPARVTGGTADLVHDLSHRLRAPGQVTVRGVAAARLLLTDGTGPLFSPKSPEHLPAALQRALRLLG